jgi:hypothetical protein
MGIAASLFGMTQPEPPAVSSPPPRRIAAVPPPPPARYVWDNLTLQPNKSWAQSDHGSKQSARREFIRLLKSQNDKLRGVCGAFFRDTEWDFLEQALFKKVPQRNEFIRGAEYVDVMIPNSHVILYRLLRTDTQVIVGAALVLHDSGYVITEDFIARDVSRIFFKFVPFVIWEPRVRGTCLIRMLCVSNNEADAQAFWHMLFIELRKTLGCSQVQVVAQVPQLHELLFQHQFVLGLRSDKETVDRNLFARRDIKTASPALATALFPVLVARSINNYLTPSDWSSSSDAAIRKADAALEHGVIVSKAL